MLDPSAIDRTAEYVRGKFEGEGSGHDWWHIYRVWKTAVYIARHEAADLCIVQLGALLHDIADWKFYDGDESIGPQRAKEWLSSLNVDAQTIEHVTQIIANISFKGAGVQSSMNSIEGKVVQDADRLDAIGAIGIARSFAYGGHKGEPIYDPQIKPQLHQTFEEYKRKKSTTINHFYEKLLLLKDTFNTETARKMASARHEFMEKFLQQFFEEWEASYIDK